MSLHMPHELKMNELKMNSIIKNRQTEVFYPINGRSGYNYANKREIEFQINRSNVLFDFPTLKLCFNNNKECTDLASNVISSVQVYIDDELVENIEKYNALEQAITVASANSNHYNTDLNILQGANLYSDVSGIDGRNGDFVCGLTMLGLTGIEQYLNVGTIRLVIRLENPSLCVADNNPYQIDNVELMIDTIETQPAYLEKMKRLMASSKGFSIPMNTYAVRSRPLSNLVNVNLAYTELQSIYMLVDKSGNSVCQFPFPEIQTIKADIGGKYLTPLTGFSGLPQIYTSMKKSLGGSIHDATGHSLLDMDKYTNKMTLIGLDCEKSPSHPELFNNGVNTKELSYTLNVETGFQGDAPQGSKLHMFTMYKQIVVFRDGGVSVME